MTGEQGKEQAKDREERNWVGRRADQTRQGKPHPVNEDTRGGERPRRQVGSCHWIGNKRPSLAKGTGLVSVPFPGGRV